MLPVRRAVIDVGTNSVKLLVADVAGERVDPVWEESKQTRLGKGFYERHQLRPEPVADTAGAVARFADTARRHAASVIRVIATSAARDAVNAADLTSAIERAAGLKTEIISGDQEAEWAFRGVTTDPGFEARSLLLMEVGGGSTQFILGRKPHKHFQASFPLGTVRLIEHAPHSDPPTAGELRACRKALQDYLAKEVQPQLEPALCRETKSAESPGGVQLVGTGGTTTILAHIDAQLATFNRERVERARLSLASVRRHLEQLWSVPLVQRQQIVGLPSKRADVILAGVAICEAVMMQFGFDDLCVSTRGLRFAAVMDEP